MNWSDNRIKPLLQQQYYFQIRGKMERDVSFKSLSLAGGGFGRG
jgi:hypothetical protein